MSRSNRRTIARRSGAALALASALLAAPVRAEETQSTESESETGIQIAAGLATLVYAPVKALYAVGGGVTAGMAYVVSAGDDDVTEPILTPSVRGDYIVRPEHLRGEKSLEFFGRAPAAEEPPAVASGDGLDESDHAKSSESDESVSFE